MTLPGMTIGAGIATNFLGLRLRSIQAATRNVRATLPANQAGDLMIVIDFDTVSNYGADQPAGWAAAFGNGSVGNGTISGSCKISTGGETGTVYSNNHTTPTAAWVIVLEGGWGSAAPVVGYVEGSFTNSNPAAATIESATRGTNPKVVISAFCATTDITSHTWSIAETGEAASDNGFEFIRFKWKLFKVGDAPVDIIMDMGDEGNNGLLGTILNLTL